MLAGDQLGRFEILGLLGAGGMGEVYRARDTGLDRDVALKVVPASFIGDDERHARFHREAKALAAFTHPHVATVYSIEDLAFPGETVSDTLVAVLSAEPDWDALPAAVPPSIVRLLQKCLRKDPRRRLHDIADARIELEDAAVGDGATGASPAIPAGATRPAVTSARRPRIALAILGWLAALALFVTPRLVSQPPAVPVRIQTLTRSGRDWSPAASPDGELIVFVSDRDGIARIWLKQLAGGSEAPVTAGPDDLPRFSPDGSQILFVRDEDDRRNLYRMAAVGGTPRKLLNDVIEAAWSPRGDRVAFLRATPVERENRMVVGLADAQTGAERTLTHIDNRVCYGLRFSPDGTQLAMSESSLTGNVAEDSFVDLIDVASGDLQRLALTEWLGPYSAVAWAPGGRSFVVGQAPDVLSYVRGSAAQILQYDLAAGTHRALFWTPLRQPAYSPDGRLVIFSSNRTGNIDLWLLDRASGVLRQLTDDPADDWDPAFTPDGERLIWSSNRSGNMEIWLAAADGSGARQITRDGVDAENPTMTADGEWIVYYSSNDANLGIWKIRPDGSDATRLVEGSVLLPEVSPDGRYALYVLFYSLRSAIQVVEVTSGELVPFEIEQGSAERHQNVVFGRARWTPDGQAIVYVGQGDQGRIGIFRQDFVPGEDTSATRTPLTGFTRDSITESLGISPDGRAVAVSVMQDQRTLRLAEHVPLTAWR